MYVTNSLKLFKRGIDMKSYALQKNNKGFTLAELLVVVAIIAVLVAVSIPIFTGRAEAAREATCEANRRSLKAELTNDYMGGKNFGAIDGVTISDDGNFTLSNQVLRQNYSENFDFNTFCPEDGIITAEFKNGSFTVYCTEHNNKHAFGNTQTIDAIKNAFSQFQNNNIDSGAVVDGDTTRTAQVIAALKKEGINLEDLGATTWKYVPYRKDGQQEAFLYWTPEDISTAKVGTKVPTIRYNTSTNTYTVWTATVSEAHNSGISDGQPYNVISNFSPYTSSTNSSAENQTYENALKYYQEAAGN